MRKVLVGLALLLCLPLIGSGQSINYYPAGGAPITTGGSSFFGGGISLGNTVASPYANLYGDAANTLALRNGTDAQSLYIYNTYVSGSDYERVRIGWDTNFFYFQVQAAGTGSTNRSFSFPSLTLTSSRVRAAGNDSIELGESTVLWQNVYLSRSTQGSKVKALTEGAATTVATVAVPQTAGSNFAAGEVQYTVYASDGTDTQTLNGSAFFSAVNKAGTESCQLTDDQIGTEASSNGTLVCTVACAVGLTDVVGITFDCTSSLTQTSLNALVRFDMQKTNTLVFP